MLPITWAVTKTISVMILLYGCISLLIVLGAGLPEGSYYFLKIANFSAWIPSAALLIALLSSEWITDGLLSRYVRKPGF